MPTYQSKIEQLIAKLCPNGVEYRELGEVCSIETGKLNANASVQDGEYYFFTTAKEISRIDKYRWNDEALLIAGNANVGDVKHYIGKFEAYQRTYVLTSFDSQVSVRFLFFVLKSSLQDYLAKNKNEAAMTYIVLSTLQNFKIPIPPLEVQQEIVDILDKFTQLEAELEAELEARKKQYEHYRNQLLTFPEGGVQWMALGEISKIKNGKDWKKLNSGNIPVYGTGGVMGYVDTFAYDKPTVLIPRKGSITNVFYINEPFWNVDTIYYTEIDTTQIAPKFFYYFMKTVDLTKLDTGSGRPSLTQAILDKIKIPIPPLAEQNRIVAILDKFDALTTDISTGLPAELKARRAQYEYYRGKLLTFEPKKHVET